MVRFIWDAGGQMDMEPFYNSDEITLALNKPWHDVC